MSGYVFTNDWTVAREPDFRKVLTSYVGQPNVAFAEVGTYEGRSACWFVDNILTGPACTMTCIDPWKPAAEQPNDDMDVIYRRYLGNVEMSPRPWAFITKRGTSERLRELRDVDMIYIDGDHSSKATLFDAVNAWKVLKVGGLLLFDDVNWMPDPPRHENDCPRTGLISFGEALLVAGHVTVVPGCADIAVLRKERE